MSELASLLPLLLIGVIFWLLLIRPANRRQREQRLMQSSVSVGDRVMLSSGFFGEVRSLGVDGHDDRLAVELSPGVVVIVARGAVGTVVEKADQEPEEPTESTETGSVGDDVADEER